METTRRWNGRGGGGEGERREVARCELALLRETDANLLRITRGLYTIHPFGIPRSFQIFLLASFFLPTVFISTRAERRGAPNVAIDPFEHGGDLGISFLHAFDTADPRTASLFIKRTCNQDERFYILESVSEWSLNFRTHFDAETRALARYFSTKCNHYTLFRILSDAPNWYNVPLKENTRSEISLLCTLNL